MLSELSTEEPLVELKFLVPFDGLSWTEDIIEFACGLDRGLLCFLSSSWFSIVDFLLHNLDHTNNLQSSFHFNGFGSLCWSVKSVGVPLVFLRSYFSCQIHYKFSFVRDLSQ
ncbi:hypothetical protein AMTRI_Chr05g73990 [Amborella trichopoda]